MTGKINGDDSTNGISSNGSKEASSSNSSGKAPNFPSYVAPSVAKQDEMNIFRAKILFAGRASELLSLACQNADQFVQAVDCHAMHNTSWPFYIIPDFG
eukprot:scaffold1988_cov121-Cylindrotheca_fusiformis.AAC.3